MIGYDNATEDTFNSEDEYTEETIGDYVISDGEESVEAKFSSLDALGFGGPSCVDHVAGADSEIPVVDIFV